MSSYPARHFANKTVIKILDVAEEQFASKGLEGARMDEIAALAGLNKSHIYYHFEGKTQVFDDLITLRLEQMKAEKEGLLAGLPTVGPGALSEFLRSVIVEVLGKRVRLLRILFVEGLLRPEGTPTLFRVVQELTNDALGRLGVLGFDLDPAEFSTTAFYMGLVPMVAHLAMGPAWARFQGVPEETVERHFLTQLEAAYGFYLTERRTKNEEPN